MATFCKYPEYLEVRSSMTGTKRTIEQTHEDLKEKNISARELAQEYLDTIEKTESEIDAFLSVEGEKALTAADKIDEKIQSGQEISVLAGIPYAVKDVICVQGMGATGGSKVLENYVAPYNATVIERLNTHNAICIGKTNCDEFAMGGSTENSGYKVTKNPHDSTRVPGGSSGGSAAAVAAGQALFSLGTDTGGSIRQPAAFCGVVGLKPTYGAVSRYGLMAMSSSLDQAGPFGNSVRDVAHIFAATAGADDKDGSSGSAKTHTVESMELDRDIKGLKIGLPKEYFGKELDGAMEKSIREVVAKFEQLGATVQEVSLPSLADALAVYYIIQPAEVSSNMARYDGMRYGKKVAGDDLIATYMETRKEFLGDEVKRRIMVGTHALSSGYYDAYYKQAQNARAAIRDEFKKVYEQVDVLVGPTTPTTAFKIGEKVEDPIQMYLADIYTVAQNVAGVPAISVPCGTVGANGRSPLPVGLQIIGKWFDEPTVLRVAHQFEQAV